MKEIALYALDAMKKAGADKASCQASQGRKDEFNVEANKFTLLRTLFDDSLSLKVLKDGKKGTTTINKLDKESVDKAVADCVALAAQGTPDEAEDIAPLATNRDFDQRVGGCDTAKLFSRAKEYLEQVRDELPKIMIEGMTAEFNANNTTYANTNGVVFNTQNEYYNAGSTFQANEGEKTSSFNYYYTNLANLDKPLLELGMQRALLEESVRSLNPRMFEGKHVGKIIVTPACADMLWYTLIDCFLHDFPMIQGTSRWKDALNTPVVHPKLTLRNSPLHPLVVGGERFTPDGFESVNYDLIKDGVLKSFALSLYAANKTGHPRAGNAAIWNMEILPGDMALADMIKGVDKGILINRFSGASPGPSGDISGVAKNSFLIENGKISDALVETMVSFNLVDVLQNVIGVSQEVNNDGYTLLPWVCLDGVTISGAS
ncbi:MAG: TldD/PmbA family protein [Defluviitaleaceae bacterium]|nr:TldD/PmbA family protein [Defluviitaleaceae bacterium]MCL2238415.1 TldD/PmbA family protein [Defluviitaleaceae bacterium]